MKHVFVNGVTEKLLKRASTPAPSRVGSINRGPGKRDKIQSVVIGAFPGEPSSRVAEKNSCHITQSSGLTGSYDRAPVEIGARGGDLREMDPNRSVAAYLAPRHALRRDL